MPTKPEPDSASQKHAGGVSASSLGVTERLQRTEATLRLLADLTPDIVMLVDPQGTILYINHVHGDLQIESVIGSDSVPYLVESSQHRYREALDRCFGQHQSDSFEHCIQGGSWWHARVVPILEGRHVPTALVISTNITQRKLAEETLRRHAQILEQIHDTVVSTDLAGIVETWNAGAERMYGYTVEEARGRPLGFLWYPEDLSRLEQELLPNLHRHGEVECTARQRRRDAQPLVAAIRLSLLRDDVGTPRGVIACANDISAQQESDQAIRREQRLLRELLAIHERDRRLTAYEIHDGIVQDVTGALLRVDALLHRTGDPPTADALREVLGLLRQSIDEGRQLISGLRPPIIDEMGIVAAIEFLIRGEFQAAGIEIEFEHDDIPRFNDLLETSVYRIVQEALSNAARHGNAPRARIVLRHRDAELFLELQDWGRGFDPSAADPTRFGLRGIRERTRILGGRSEIDSRPGEGTILRVWLPPLPREAAPETETPAPERIGTRTSPDAIERVEWTPKGD